MTKLFLALTLRKRLLLFICVLLICFFVDGAISALVTWKVGTTTPAIRIVTILQDLILFVVPAIITAVLVTRQPATLLCVDRLPRYDISVVSVLVLVAAIPAMNYVIFLNKNIPLPEGLASALWDMENNAESLIGILQGPHDVPNLIMSLLIVAILAGFSEELLFRGAFQRLLSTGGVGTHAAIWISALLFSLLHMQFFGFVPRMLLGAFFGYALWWSGSLWLPIMLHMLNNGLYVIFQWFAESENEKAVIDTIGYGGDYWCVLISLALVSLGLWGMRSLSLINKAHQSRPDA